MKFLATILCFYFTILTVLPTVKMVRMTCMETCRASCCKKASEEDPNGCQKQKCVLNFNINNATFMVFDTDYQLPKKVVDFVIKEKTDYHTHLIAHYKVAIWQPPESGMTS